jgi:hypothetical protein
MISLTVTLRLVFGLNLHGQSECQAVPFPMNQGHDYTKDGCITWALRGVGGGSSGSSNRSNQMCPRVMRCFSYWMQRPTRVSRVRCTLLQPQ